MLARFAQGSLVTQNSAGSVEWAGGRLDAVRTVLTIGERMLYVKRAMRKRYNNRATLEFNDEYDDQDLLRTLLTVFFSDIRPEAWTPNYAGGSSRIDFVLPEFALAVELKTARASMTAKSVSDELIVDRDRYKELGTITHLVCLVFDYDGYLINPRGLERDLSREATAEGLAATVRIYDR